MSFKAEQIEPTDCRGEVIAANVSPRRQTFEAKFEKWRQIKHVEDQRKERMEALKAADFENFIRSEESFSRKTKLYKSKSSLLLSTCLLYTSDAADE